ncbi:MAG: HAMP domain-containing sensor histidine kinase [Sandaracinus sp.]
MSEGVSLAASGLVALALAIAAMRARREGREELPLALFGLAAAVLSGSAWALVPLGVASLGAWRLHHRWRATEREREAAARYLASVQVTSTGVRHGEAPTVQDAEAREAIALVGRLAEESARRALAAKAEPAPPPPPAPAPAPKTSLRPSSRSSSSLRAPASVRARFMAAMGHELRSPLNSITGFAQLLEDGSDGPLNDAQRENVMLVRRAAEELLTLLTDILDAARIEAGRFQLRKEWVAPVEVLTRALDRARALPELEGQQVEAQIQPGLGAIYVDRARLGQALCNVLRAIGRAKRTVHARVRESYEGERPVIRFEIHDRSRPITDAEAARLFDSDPAARPAGRSLALGLALSLARELAQMHRGGARAEPFDGGTAWIVWIPAEPPPDAPGAGGTRSRARGPRGTRSDPGVR